MCRGALELLVFNSVVALHGMYIKKNLYLIDIFFVRMEYLDTHQGKIAIQNKHIF